MMEEGDMTKTASHNEIVELISNNLPELTLNLLSKETGISYSCKTDEQITIPEGPYTITYSQETERYAGGKEPGQGDPLEAPQLSKKPQVKIKETEITISHDIPVISLSAEYDCFVIVVDKAETKKVVLTKWVGAIYSQIRNVDCQFISNENTCISFLARKPGTYTFNVVPIDETKYLPKEYSIHSDELHTGKYYRFHPYSILNTVTSIGLEYPDWVEGAI